MFPVVVGGGAVDVVATPGDAVMAGVLSFEDPEASAILSAISLSIHSLCAAENSVSALGVSPSDITNKLFGCCFANPFNKLFGCCFANPLTEPRARGL